MKIHVDVSLFCSQSGAFGNIHGDLELAGVPAVGSSIVFMSPSNGVLPVRVPGFGGSLKVTDVRFAVGQTMTAGISVSLDDLVLHSEDDARQVMKYLELGFGLFGDEYEGGSQ
jgi:hypothetical protein